MKELDQAEMYSFAAQSHMKEFHPKGKPDPKNCPTCNLFGLGIPQPKDTCKAVIIDLSKKRIVDIDDLPF